MEPATTDKQEDTRPKGPRWKGPRNVPVNLKAKERKRIREAQKVTRKAYNGQ